MKSHNNHKIIVSLITYKYVLFYCENCNISYKKYLNQLTKKEKELYNKEELK